MPLSRTRLFALLIALSVSSVPASAQTYSWNGPSAGAWLTPANWAGGPAGTYPGVSAAPGSGTAADIAQFANAATSVGIDMGAAGGLLTLGAVDFRSATGLTIGNSSTTTAGALRLNGATVNAVANTLVAVGNTGADLTIANNAAGGSSNMDLQLGVANGVFNVFGDATATRSLTISSNVTEANAGSGFTVQGGGNVSLSGTNAFTGNVTIASGRVTVTNAAGLGAGAGRTIVQNGGTVYLNAALTTNENFAVGGNGFTEAVGNAGALRFGNFAITVGGNINLTANTRVFVDGSTTTVTGAVQETGGARTLEKTGAGTLLLNGANTYTGATTVLLGTLAVGGSAGTLATPSVAVLNGATLRLDNATGANLGNRLADTAPVSLTNGTLNFNHNATDAINFSETVGPVTVGTYLNTITASQAAAGQTSALTIASLARVGTGGINFTGTALGADARNTVVIAAAPTLDAGGLIGPWAIYNGTDFATYNTAGTASVAAAVSLLNEANEANWTPTSNLKFTTGTFTTTADRTVHSLALTPTAAANFTVGTGTTLRIASGGILASGSTPTVTGGSITAGTTAGTSAEMIVHAVNNITVASNITDNGAGAVSLTKLGGGILNLSGTNTFSGPVVTTGGTLQLSSDAALGNTTSVTVKRVPGGGNGALVQLNGGRTMGTGVTLNLESELTNGINGAATAPIGLNARTGIQGAGGAGVTNTWNGAITLAGNNFINVLAAAGTTLALNGPVSAGAGGFTGNFLLRGNGTVAVTNAVNIPIGSVATTEGTTVALISPNAGHNWAATNVFAGFVRLNGNNALPTTAALTLGQIGSANVGTLQLNGFNQTIPGLATPGPAANVVSQVIENGNASAASASTLTYAGGANPSVYGGILRDSATAGTGTLALAVTSGSLTLSGGTNTYSGGTTVTGGTLLLTNTAGSGTGTGAVTVTGGRLGGTGIITPTAANAVQVAAGGTLAPGGGVGTLKSNSGVTVAGSFEADVTAATSDTLDVTGNVTLTGASLVLPGSNAYNPATTYTLITSTGTRTGTFANFAQGQTIASGTHFVNYTAGGVQLVPVPEPATILGLAAGGLWLARRRYRAAAEPTGR